MIDLSQLSEGQPAKVISIEGGVDISKRIQGLGIREGSTVIKVTGLFSRGPIIVKVGHTQIALGRGMAAKVMVEPINK